MSDPKINPNQVTKPIQLLAAWLVGLILINGSFLGAAKVINEPSWAPGLLVIASILNVPIFLSLIFFLQTKFRAELQEDTYYSKHLEKVTRKVQERSAPDKELLAEFKNLRKSNSNKISEIERNINDIYKYLTEHQSGGVDFQSLLEQVSETKESLESYEQQKEKAATRIALNDLIPSYKEVASKLITSGYSIYQKFGSTSEDKAPPKFLTITYLSGTPKIVIREIFEILRPFGFDRIDCDDSAEHFMNQADIYIGSYIDSFPNERKSVKIDQSLEGLILDDSVTEEQLSEYIEAQRA